MSWYHLTDEEADHLNPPFSPLPKIEALYDDDAGEVTLSFRNHPGWLRAGHLPRPSTRFGWFFHHLFHGLLMRYPLHKVIGYALFESKESS